jgi:hypothetical protein
MSDSRSRKSDAGFRLSSLVQQALEPQSGGGRNQLHSKADDVRRMRVRSLSFRCGIAPMLFSTLTLAACSGSTGPSVAPPGQPESTKTKVLEAGAVALQRDAPPDALDIYLVGFHPLKAEPKHQTEAHHFCRQVNEDFAQCVLFDGNTEQANLTGIEYIISERLFATLPKAEKQYWHPHNGEILSGQLVAPGLPAPAEKELMRSKMNSYGKTWHTWNTSHGGVAGDPLPLGQPVLAWSFSRFGEADPALVAGRDQRMGINSEQLRQQRQDLVPLARPQTGVDALKGAFGRPTQPIPGVVDQSSAR